MNSSRRTSVSISFAQVVTTDFSSWLLVMRPLGVRTVAAHNALPSLLRGGSCRIQGTGSPCDQLAFRGRRAGAGRLVR